MEGECIGVRALQGYYPPRLAFNIRLKNNSIQTSTGLFLVMEDM